MRIAHLLTVIACALFVASCMGESGRYADDPVRAVERTKAYLENSGDRTYETEAPSDLSVGQVDLGRKLFDDRRLSANGRFSCSDCHIPAQAYTQNGRPLPDGVTWQEGGRNSPSLLDVINRKSFFHDGRAATLAEQAAGPLTNPAEMANPSMEALAERVRGMDDYERFFSYAFGGPATAGNIATALAAYQKTLVTGPSRFDQWKFQGKQKALSEAEARGYLLFKEKGNCSSCHLIGENSAPLTDEKFHDTGYSKTKPADWAEVDKGRYAVTKRRSDLYAFRTPSLRNVALTGPYMHDGRLKTLDEVVRFFNHADELELSDGEIDDLVAFLKSLTSKRRPGRA